jgi:TonB family protein
MRLREESARLRRGAAPADERTSFMCIGVAGAAHAALLLLFVSWARPPIYVALPGGGGPATPRAQLVRITPLRTFPAPQAPAQEAKVSRPKPALIKRYTPGAKIEIKPERSPTKRDEGKAAPSNVSASPQADNALRWSSLDASRSLGVRTDGDFQWAYYLASVRNKIGAQWVPPPGLQGRQARATLYFRIHRDGQITSAGLESPSGMTFFDQTAMRALLAATPLPPLPAGYRNEWLGVHLGFEFEQ